MKYGMTFLVDMYDFDEQQELQVLTTPGDYIRMSRWVAENLPETDAEDVRNLRANYATVWFAFSRRGQLAQRGLPEELTAEAIDAMADRYSIYVNDVKEGSLPLAGTPGR